MRKHVIQNAIQQEVESPGENQYIVRAVGGRGSNIIEVEFPDGRRTLCLLPARFHKKLWVKNGNYLIVEEAKDAEGRVTGQIIAVLFAEHVKELKRMAGVWPPEFIPSEATASAATEALQDLRLGSREAKGAAAAATSPASAEGTAAELAARGGEGSGSGSSSEDDLPPIERINNRKVVAYEEVSDSSDSDG